MRAKLLRAMDCRPTKAFPNGIKPAGTVVDHPRAFWLVRMGVATAADDECRAKVGRTPEQLVAAQEAYPRVEAGIHPDDYEAFDRGLMTGYDENGAWIPGPNFEADDPELDDDDEDEDDEDEE